jgi:DNA-binding response OmpR family regulator
MFRFRKCEQKIPVVARWFERLSVGKWKNSAEFAERAESASSRPSTPQVEGMKMRVLVVEVDRALGLFLQKGLIMSGHNVELVASGEAALEQAAERPPDLMVLDLSAPMADGSDVLEQMQQRIAATSVLVLSGCGAIEERVRCLNLGADDFLHKPFSFHELSARCRAILRRREQFADPVLRFGSVELNRIDRSVLHGGRAVLLTGKEFSLLEFLLRREGECCSREDLLGGVWQSSPEAAPNVVDVYITYLRRKLSAAWPQAVESAIETVRGAGYRMRATRKRPQTEDQLSSRADTRQA